MADTFFFLPLPLRTGWALASSPLSGAVRSTWPQSTLPLISLRYEPVRITVKELVIVLGRPGCFHFRSQRTARWISQDSVPRRVLNGATQDGAWKTPIPVSHGTHQLLCENRMM